MSWSDAVSSAVHALMGVGIVILSGTSDIAAQVDPRVEGRLLREAAARESGGDYSAAEAVLRRLMEQHPASSGGLFALERVLRAQGRTIEVLPVADRFVETDPGATGARYLRLRVLEEVDSLDAIVREAERWIDDDPASADPCREVAKVYEEAFGAERAIAVLELCRTRLDDPQALSLEMAALLLRLERTEEAIEELSRAVGEDGESVDAVVRVVSELRGASDSLIRGLLDALESDPTTSGRRIAGVRIALESDLTEEASRLAESVARSLTPRARQGFLTDLGRRAQNASAHDVALWAYAALREEATDDVTARMLNTRIAATALVVGDTAAALDAQGRLASALNPRSSERREVLADVLRVSAGRDGPASIQDRLAEFGSEFPDAPVLDELTALAAAGLHARGHADAARAILEGSSGPRSSLEWAYIQLDGGGLKGGQVALAEAVQGLPPPHATDVIQLIALLERLGPLGKDALAASAVLVHRDERVRAVDLLDDAAATVAGQDRPALLAQAARLADAGGARERTASLRRRIVDEYPDSPETPEAMLALAQHYGSSEEGRDEAVGMLESLIVGRPDSPVVPAARRELQKLRALAGGPVSGGPG